MESKGAIGIDPDAHGFVCALVNGQEPKVISRTFLVTDSDLGAFLRWVKAQTDILIAIEGSGGQSRPIEKLLREAGLIFYSFKPADTDKFRKAVLGQNKNNLRDAESVARYALALQAQGKLDRYRRIWFADPQLQPLTRSYERLSQQMTAEINRLWKLIRQAAPDLYLALGDSHPEVNLGANTLKNGGFLTLLANKPDPGQWKTLSEAELLEDMGGFSSAGRRRIVQGLHVLSTRLPSCSASLALLIQASAQRISMFKAHLAAIIAMLDTITQDNSAVAALRQTRGIATVTASTLVAEIIDIRRFPREDSLACYAGLGRKEHSTGQSTRMVPSSLFNHRLKDAFMTAARNVVRFNPDSHLAGYCRNLIKRGMSPLEAYKRVARALVRVFYRTLNGLLPHDTRDDTNSDEAGSDMASGQARSDGCHQSNMPLPAQRHGTTQRVQRIKRDGAKPHVSRRPRKVATDQRRS
jgi:transposase